MITHQRFETFPTLSDFPFLGGLPIPVLLFSLHLGFFGTVVQHKEGLAVVFGDAKSTKKHLSVSMHVFSYIQHACPKRKLAIFVNQKYRYVNYVNNMIYLYVYVICKCGTSQFTIPRDPGSAKLRMVSWNINT